MKKIEEAKKDGSWILLDKIEALEMPAAIKKAFTKNKPALENFMAFPPGVKKQTHQWIICAKTETTIKKRIEETISLAKKNIRANQWKPK